MCDRFACDAFVIVDFWRFGGVDNGMLFECDQGVRTSVTICGACDGFDVHHCSDGTGADAIRVRVWNLEMITIFVNFVLWQFTSYMLPNATHLMMHIPLIRDIL